MPEGGGLVVGVDVGTSSMKAAVFDLQRSSEPLVVVRRTAVTRSAAARSEVDADVLWEGVFACLRETISRVDAAAIEAIGVSGTACGAWLLDEHHALVRAPILWNDGRAADIVEAWVASGFIERIFDVSGNSVFPGFTLPTLAWLARHEPSSLERATKVVFAKDWIRFKLTGVISSEIGDASFVPFDLRTGTWSTELFAEAGLAQYTTLLPTLADYDTAVELTSSMADALGVPRSTIVSVGATDIVAGLMGAGAAESGVGVTILGTSANSSVVSDAPNFEPAGIGMAAAMPFGRFARTMVSTSGTTTFDWAARIFAEGDLARFLRDADACADDADRPVLVPYLSPAGTVSPPDPSARGSLSGLRTHHDRPEIARAVVEGLGFAVADNYRSMVTPPRTIVAIGGGARSDLLLQTISDAVGVPVTRASGEEFGARGVALLAGYAAGALTSEQALELSGSFTRERIFLPEPQRVAYQLAGYAATRDALRRTWPT